MLTGIQDSVAAGRESAREDRGEKRPGGGSWAAAAGLARTPHAGLAPNTSNQERAAAVAHEDGRRSRLSKCGLGAQGQAFIGMLRMCVFAACDQGTASRASIAEALEIPERTLERWLSPSEPHVPRFDKVMQLLDADRSPLPAEQRRWMQAWLDREAGRLAVDLVQADPAEVRLHVLRVFASGGRIADLVADMTAPESDGGAEISAAEAGVLLPLAREELSQAAALVASLEELTSAAKRRGCDVLA